MDLSLKHLLSANKSIAIGIIALSCVGVAQIIKNEVNLAEDKPLATEDESRDPSQTAESSKEIEFDKLTNAELIALLSHDDFKIRKQAHKHVWMAGKAIIPDLENTSRSDDPELVMRSSDILKYLRIGVRHDTPKHIAEKVAEFQTASLDKQEDILQFLFQQRAYNQMVYMLAEMDNRHHADKLYANFKQVGHLAAREALAVDNVIGAIELLKMSPQTPFVRRSLAFLYARTGRAEAEYEILAQQLEKGDVDKEWMLMLLQELSDRTKLRDFASKTGSRSTLAVLDLLDGDPTGINHIVTERPNLTKQKAIRIVENIYNAKPKEINESAHVELLALARVERLKKKFLPMHLLFLTGGERLAESVLLEAAPSKAFNFLDSRERPAEALAAINITDMESLKKWRDPIIARLISKDEEDEKQRIEKERSPDFIDDEEFLFEVAFFYQRRGAIDKVKFILAPFLKAVYKTDKDRWFGLISDLPKYGMHDVALHYIEEQATDDEIARLVNIMFDDTEYTDLIWESFSARQDSSVKENFQDFCVMMGMYRNKTAEIKKLESKLLDSAKRNGVEAADEMIKALYRMADFRIDSPGSSKYLKEIMKNQENEDLARSRTQDLISATAMSLEWKKLSELFKSNPTIGDKSCEWLTIRSIAERKLGNDIEADALLEKAILMTVGLRDELYDVINELSWSEDSERANALLERELLVHSENANDDTLFFAIGVLASDSSHYIKNHEWGKAAAMAYAANIITIHYGREHILNAGQMMNMMNMNYTLNFSRGMEFHKKGEHDKAKLLLSNANECLLGEGILADHFYPTVRNTGYQKKYESWVKRSHEHLISSITEFPNSANTRNTLAWVLSRSARSLDEGIVHVTKALELLENEAAYLDTMGELWFAKGDRKKAVEWGDKAVKSSMSGRLVNRASRYSTKRRTLSLGGQRERFKSAPFPNPKVEKDPVN